MTDSLLCKKKCLVLKIGQTMFSYYIGSSFLHFEKQSLQVSHAPSQIVSVMEPVFEIKGAPCAHHLAAGCAIVRTCALGECTLSWSISIHYIGMNTRKTRRVHDFKSLCTRCVRKINA